MLCRYADFLKDLLMLYIALIHELQAVNKCDMILYYAELMESTEKV